MDIFNTIFGELVFTKVKITDGFAMYIAPLQSFVSKGRQTVVLFVPLNKAYLSKAYIYQLDWSCLQTRIIDDFYNISDQKLDPKHLDTRYDSFKTILYLKQRNTNNTEYTCFLPIDTMLLHDPKKKTIYQHPDEIELRHALKTFNCVIKVRR